MLFSQQLRTFSYVKDSSLVLTPSDVGKIMAITPSDSPNVAKIYDGSISMIPLGKMIAYNTNEVIIESTNIQKLTINNSTLIGSDYIITEPYIGSLFTTVTDLDPLQLVYPDSNGFGIAYSVNDTNKPTGAHLGYLAQSKSTTTEFLVCKNLHFASFSSGGGGSGMGENGLYNGASAIRLGGPLIEDTFITTGNSTHPATDDYNISIIKQITDISGTFNPKYNLFNYANFDLINASETTSAYRNIDNTLQIVGDSDNDSNPGATILEFMFNDAFVNTFNRSVYNWVDITPSSATQHISLIGNNLNILTIGNLRLLDDYSTPDPTRSPYMAVDHNVLNFEDIGNIETRNLIVNGGANTNYGRLIGLNLNVYGNSLTGSLNGDIFPIYQDYSRIDTIYTSGEYYIKNFFNSPIGIRTETPLAHLHIDCTSVLYPTASWANGGGLLITGDVGTVPLNYDSSELGVGTRFMWIPERKSLYAGDVIGSSWDSANIGYYNYNFGTDNLSSGNYGFVFGTSNTNIGYNCVIIGSGTASNDGNYNSIFSTIGSSISLGVDNSSIIGGVANNINSGQDNVILGGVSNNINHTNSTITNSSLTKTLHSNSITWAGKDVDSLSTINGAQTTIPINNQTSATPLDLLTTDGTNITLPADTIVFFNIKIVARNTVTNDTAQQFFRLGGYVDSLSVLQISPTNNEFYVVPATSAFVMGDITITTTSNELVITGNALNTIYYGTVEITYQTPI